MKKLIGIFTVAAFVFAGMHTLRRHQNETLVSPAERQTLRDSLQSGGEGGNAAGAPDSAMGQLGGGLQPFQPSVQPAAQEQTAEETFSDQLHRQADKLLRAPDSARQPSPLRLVRAEFVLDEIKQIDFAGRYGGCVYVNPVKKGSKFEKQLIFDRDSWPVSQLVSLNIGGQEWILASAKDDKSGYDDTPPDYDYFASMTNCIDTSAHPDMKPRSYEDYQGPSAACSGWALCDGKPEFLVCPASGDKQCPPADQCRQKMETLASANSRPADAPQDMGLTIDRAPKGGDGFTRKPILVGKTVSPAKTEGICVGDEAVSATLDGACPPLPEAKADSCVSETDGITISKYK